MNARTSGQRTRWMTVAAAAAALFYVGCGPVGGEPVDHGKSQQHLEQSSQTLSDRLSTSTEFLETSDLLSYSYETTYHNDCASGSSGGSTPDGPSSCEPDGNEDFNFDEPISRAADQGLKELREHVFKKDNIVNQSRTSVTYAIEGEDVCQKTYESCTYDSEGGETCEHEPNEHYSTCRQNVNDMKIRVCVTRPEADTYKYAIRVAPESYQPVSFTVGKAKLATTADLGDIKRSVDHYDDVYDVDVSQDFPSTMKGRIRAELRSDAPKQTHFEIKIEKAINVSGNDYDVALAQAAKPVFGITADGRSEKLTTTVDFNKIQANWPVEHWQHSGGTRPESDGSSSEEKSKTLQYAINLAGASAKAMFQAGSDEFEFTNISLGNSTSWLKIAGKKAVTADLNPQDGRVFGATLGVQENNDGSVEAFTLDVRPAFDLSVDFDFTHVSDWVDVSSWMENYSFQALLAGANPASLLVNQQHLKVTAGRLELSSKTPNASRKVQTDQCLTYEDNEPSSCDPDSTNCDSGGSSEPYHPLRDLKVTDCSGS